jgi:hypothetical protein
VYPEFHNRDLNRNPVISIASTYAEPKVVNPCPTKLSISIMLASLGAAYSGISQIPFVIH